MSDQSANPVSDPSRLRALHGTALLDSPTEAAFDRLTRLATRILRAPVALVSLVDRDRQFFKSCVGLPEPWASMRETPLSHSFCQHTIASAEPLLISDAREHPLVRENLAIRDMNVIAYAGIPLVTADGQALGSFCVIDTQPRTWTEDEVEILRELAASVLTEIELRRATREAQEATQEREALLSIASHELKNPLSSLLGYAELLARRAKPGNVIAERDQRAVQTIIDQGTRLKRMLDILLDAANIENRQLVIEQEPIDLHPIVARIITELEPTLKNHSIEYTHPGTPAIVQGDEVRLDQVVHNLLANAVKYSPEGGPIKVDLTIANRQVCLVVQDQGIGIPPDALPHIFQRFSRIRTERSKYIGGLGLGLYVVKEIITLHGGTIGVDSTEGKGSTFTVCLPEHVPQATYSNASDIQQTDPVLVG